MGIELDRAALELFLRLVGGLHLLQAALVGTRARLLFLSERWGGYAGSGRLDRVVGSPAGLLISSVLWVAACVGLIAQRAVVASASVLVLIGYHHFVRGRWTSVARGCGAPGFVTAWLSWASLLLALVLSGSLPRPELLAWTLIVEFALIFLVAGYYKSRSGYRSGRGVHLGLINPHWSYAPRFWRRVGSHSPLIRLLDLYGWVGELVGAALILIPATRTIGAAILAAMFIALVPLIRLGALPVAVLLQCLLVVLLADDPSARSIRAWLVPGAGTPVEPGTAVPASVLVTVVVAYLTLVLLGYGGMLANLFAAWRPHPRVQRALDRVTNRLGLILWRVFTSDVTGFHIRILAVLADGSVRPLPPWGGSPWHRFGDVTEAIAVTTVFTSRRYFPGRREIFEDRLRRYARTLPGDAVAHRFEYWTIEPDAEGFSRHAATFTVDRATGAVEERIHLPEDVTVRPYAGSAVSPGSVPGSYRPA